MENRETLSGQLGYNLLAEKFELVFKGQVGKQKRASV